MEFFIPNYYDLAKLQIRILLKFTIVLIITRIKIMKKL
jgi:hypothetical protein